MPTPNTNPQQGELDTILDAMPRVARRPRNDNDPLMPFETNLDLTRAQEERLVMHVMRRFEEVNEESGRHLAATLTNDAEFRGAMASMHAQGILAKHMPWMVRRSLYYRHFYNDYTDRLQEGTIYANSNLSASLSPRITLQVAGKLKSTLFGAEPWFSASPVGESDEELARRTREFTRYKARAAGLLEAEKEAIDLACIVGETVTKTTFVDDRIWYWRKSPILVDAKGVARFDSNGQYIFQEDRFIPEMQEQQPDPNMEPVMAPTGRMVLRRDNTVVMNPGDRWEVRRVRVGDTVYRGAKTKAIYFTDFLCPLDATSIDEADVCFHIYDRPAMEVASWFLQGRFSHMSNQGEVEVNAKNALDLLRDVAASASAHTGINSDVPITRTLHGEPQDIAAQGSSGLIRVIEAWVRFDADEDGIQEEIVVMIDMATGLPLYYEYTGMATDDRRRPFVVQRVLPVYGRWYGQGIMEYLESEQLFVDLLVNRWNVTLSQGGQVIFWDPKKTKEGMENPNLVLNAGKTYTIHGDYKAEEILEIVELYAKDRAGDLKDMIQFFMQLMQLKTGVMSVADESISTMESTKLATGIRALERSGDQMFSSWLGETAGCGKKVVEKFVTTTLMRMDQRETFEFTEGENTVLMDLSREDVIGLGMNVEIMLVNDEGERVQASTDKFFAMVERMVAIAATAPETAQAMIPVAVIAARALKIPNPESVIVLPQPLPPMMGAMPGPAAGGGRPSGQQSDMAMQALPDMF